VLALAAHATADGSPGSVHFAKKADASFDA
jgi:hypothetical protein